MLVSFSVRIVRDKIPVFILLLAVSVAFFWEAAFFTKAFFYCDIVGFHLPRQQFLGERILEGEFPLWCPRLLCGFPLFGGGQSGFLYPPNLVLLLLLPPWKALNIMTVLNFFLCSCFMYLYLRTRLGAFPSLAGSAAFAYGGYFLCHSFHTTQVSVAIWLPLLFLCADRALDRASLRAALAGAAVLAVMCFAGYPNTFLVCTVGISFYMLYRGAFSGCWRDLVACMLVLALIVAVGVGMSFVQILPLAETTALSVRQGPMPYPFMVEGSYSPAYLATLLVPDLFGNRATDTEWLGEITPYHEMDVYMGILPFLLLLVASMHLKNRRAVVWLALLFTSLVLMFGKYTLFYRLFGHLPYFDRMRVPCKFSLLFCFSSSVLAAHGAEYLWRGGRPRWWPLAAATALAIASVGIVYYRAYDGIFGRLALPEAYHIAPVSLQRLERLKSLVVSGSVRAACFLAIGVCLVAASRFRAAGGKVVAALSLLFILIDLFIFSRSRVALIRKDFFTRLPPSVAVLPRDAGLFRIYSEDPPPDLSYVRPGWALTDQPYYDSLSALPYDTQMLYGLSSIGGGSPLITLRMHRARSIWSRNLTDMLNGRYIYSWQRLPDKGLELIYGRGPYVYLNKRALDRAYVVPSAVFAASGEEALAAVTGGGFRPREAVVIEGAVPWEFQLGGGGIPGAEPRIEEYRDREVVIDVSMPYNGFLVLSDTYYPGWRAEDNGQEVKIYRANYLVRAVYLEKGKHLVRFVYSPASFRRGLIVSLSFVALAALLCVFGVRAAGAFLGVRRQDGKAIPGARLAVLAAVAVLITCSILFQPDFWKDAFMALRIP